MTLTEAVIKRPTIVVVMFAVFGLLGLFSYTQLKYELLPRITPPIVTIMTIYPGASPNEVETGVSKVIEEAVSGIDKVSAVTSTSQEGLSFVTIEFLQSADINVGLQDAQRKVGEVLSRLPSDAKAPTLSKFALDEIPVLRMGVVSSMEPRAMYETMKERLKPRLSKVPGVGQVTLVGGEEREVKVNLDEHRLRAYGIGIPQALMAIKTANLDFPTGNVKDNQREYVVRVAGKFTSIDDLRNLVVARSRAGGQVRLSDVAEVTDGQKDYVNIARINGHTAIGVLVQKQSDANAVDVSIGVRKEIAAIEQEYANVQMKFDVAQDGSMFTTDAARAVKEDLAVAVVLVGIVMLLFLHSLRNSFIVMIAIPASLITTFAVMYMFGYSLNLMTLLGLSLVVGILVDDSIVVLENIYRHLEMGETPRVAALRGRNEIGFTALSITMVDVAVFLPLTLVSGLVGNIMREFAVVVVASTLLSLLVSFTVTPVLASRMARLDRFTRDTVFGRFVLGFENLYHRFTDLYLRTLKWSLTHRWKVLAATVVLFIATIALVPLGFIGGEFMTQTDRGEFSVAIELAPGTTVEQTNRIARDVEQNILKIAEVRKVFSNVGVSSEGLIGISSPNVADITVTLAPKEQRKRSTDDVGRQIKSELALLPGVKVRVNPIGIFGTANQTPIAMLVSGADRDSVRRGAEHLMALTKATPGTADVRLSSEEGKPETAVEIDRQKMASYGLSIAEVGAALRTALSGDDEAKYREGTTEYDIRIQLDQFDRSKPSDVEDITFVNNQGKPVQLKQFATVYQTTGPTKLQRRDRNSAITVFAQAVGRPTGTIAQDIDARLAKSPLPSGTTLTQLGDVKNQKEGFGSLGYALLAAIIFVYLVMVALYNSYVHPFVVLFSIPVAIIGALLALALTMKSLSIFSILGVIMLVGLVGKNAILLVDFTNKLRAEGYSTFDALMEAGKERLRPILMTTMTMIFGMLPIAISTSPGAEWKTGLAWALVGGLTSSMFLTLLVVPIVYFKMDGWRTAIPALFGKVFGRRKATTTAVQGDVAPEQPW